MLKTATYQEKFQRLEPWIMEIVTCVKSELKRDHLRTDRRFLTSYLPNKHMKSLSTEDLAQGYAKALQEGEEEVGELIVTRWLLKHSDLYGYFEGRLRAINPKFDEIEQLEEAVARDIAEEACGKFGALNTYVFSVFNSVVFPEVVYGELAERASAEQLQRREAEERSQAIEDLEGLRKHHERELARMQDRYEKKISGLEKKYLKDTGLLKKQIGDLQRKMQATAAL